MADTMGEAEAQLAANVQDLSREFSVERAARENAEEAKATAEAARALVEAEREQLRADRVTAEREQADPHAARIKQELEAQEPRNRARRSRR